MSKNQKRAFWSMFIVFCVLATALIYPQGVFENLSIGGALILTVSYMIVALFIRGFVKSNPDAIDKWFE